jgi:hypothetical protein
VLCAYPELFAVKKYTKTTRLFKTKKGISAINATAFGKGKMLDVWRTLFYGSGV